MGNNRSIPWQMTCRIGTAKRMASTKVEGKGGGEMTYLKCLEQGGKGENPEGGSEKKRGSCGLSHSFLFGMLSLMARGSRGRGVHKGSHRGPRRGTTVS